MSCSSVLNPVLCHGEFEVPSSSPKYTLSISHSLPSPLPSPAQRRETLSPDLAQGRPHLCPPLLRVEFWALKSAGCAIWTRPGTSVSPNIPSLGWMESLRKAVFPLATTSGKPHYLTGADTTGTPKEVHLRQKYIIRRKFLISFF